MFGKEKEGPKEEFDVVPTLEQMGGNFHSNDWLWQHIIAYDLYVPIGPTVAIGLDKHSNALC
jgi:hypothetical protein